MGKAAPKITLSPSRDIPFDKLILSQSNVRAIKCGVSIGELANDIVRRTLIQSLNVRPLHDEAGAETGMFEVPAGGRRYRALELLVSQKRLAKDAAVPCVVRTVSSDEEPTAAEDSLAENVFREQLHPLDQFRAMQILADEGSPIEDIAARFMTSPAVVRQRLRLASVSPVLCAVYAEDGMTLEQLMAFSVCEDHPRQERVWDQLAHSWNKGAAYIRQRLTEESVRASDRRVRFVGLEAYVAAGGVVMRDLFEDDRGGWLQDVGLLDQLVIEKLGAEGERIGSEGWKWIAVAMDFAYGNTDGMREIDGARAPISEAEQAEIDALQAEADALEAEYGEASDVPDAVNARIEAIDEAIAALLERPMVYDPRDTARAGAFVSLDHDGTLHVERGFVRSEDEATRDDIDEQTDVGDEADKLAGPQLPERAIVTVNGEPDSGSGEDDDDGAIKPLPDKLVSELTAHRTLALCDALANHPLVAFAAVLHAMVLSTFYYASRESCMGISVQRPTFAHQEAGLKDCASARSIAVRHDQWKDRLPKSEKDLWVALLELDADAQAALFAHCASYAVSAVWEAVGKYDSGRTSSHMVERRIAHSDILARAVDLDLVAVGWKPTVDNYLGRVTKSRIIEAVTEAKGEQTASLIDHLKKGDMAREAARLLDDAGWLPEPLRTPSIESDMTAGSETAPTDAASIDELPAFLDPSQGNHESAEADANEGYAIAAE